MVSFKPSAGLLSALNAILFLTMLKLSFTLLNFNASSKSTDALKLLPNCANVPSASVVVLSVFNKFKVAAIFPLPSPVGTLPVIGLNTELL